MSSNPTSAPPMGVDPGRVEIGLDLEGFRRRGHRLRHLGAAGSGANQVGPPALCAIGRHRLRLAMPSASRDSPRSTVFAAPLSVARLDSLPVPPASPDPQWSRLSAAWRRGASRVVGNSRLHPMRTMVARAKARRVRLSIRSYAVFPRRTHHFEGPGDRIIASMVPGMAAQEPLHRELRPGPKSMRRDGHVSVLGTAWREPAGARQPGRDEVLVSEGAVRAEHEPLHQVR